MKNGIGGTGEIDGSVSLVPGRRDQGSAGEVYSPIQSAAPSQCMQVASASDMSGLLALIVDPAGVRVSYTELSYGPCLMPDMPGMPDRCCSCCPLCTSCRMDTRVRGVRCSCCG